MPTDVVGAVPSSLYLIAATSTQILALTAPVGTDPDEHEAVTRETAELRAVI
jgi:hypothetical protein